MLYAYSSGCNLMLDFTSVKVRFMVSLAANTSRALLSFITGLLVARGLNPSGYGEYSFLLGSFNAIRSILDMGSSNAFYTFISQKTQCRRFYIDYFCWLATQFIFTALMITLLMPQEMVQKIWLGHNRFIILLAFAASFMQQQVWQTLSQIGESSRKTIRVQIISMAIGIGHLVLVALLLLQGLLSVQLLFFIVIVEYVIATIFSFRFLRRKESELVDEVVGKYSFKTTLDEYKKYCKPLIIGAYLGFLHDFADRWMLQRFGGAGQQGFYQISYQFSAVSLLATSSILNVFWKEIAEAHARGDTQRVASVYHKVNRGLTMTGAILSGFLIPWTEQIVTVFLGKSYLMAVPVLMIMFLYPIHQSMGQVGGTMLLASGHTYSYMVISVIIMLISLPLSYLVQASPSGLLIPGLGLGAIGMALKMVSINIISVNVISWSIARYRHWKYDWYNQFVGIISVISLGFMSKYIVGLFISLDRDIDRFLLILPLLCSGLIYLLTVTGLILMMPSLIGMSNEEIMVIIRKYKNNRNG